MSLIQRLYVLSISLVLLGILAVSQVRAESNIYVGTGFFVQDQIIITARHVVVGHKILNVYYNGHRYAAVVIAEDKAQDMTLLRIKTGSFTPYALIGDVKDGEVVTVLGFDLGESRLHRHKVTIKNNEDLNNWLEGHVTDDETCQGDSGGPLVNKDNKVVGIEDRGSIEPEDITRKGCSKLGWAIKPSYIHSFLIKNNIIPLTSTSTVNVVYIENIT